jgi:uncharacterized membrane protein HdeD (DUF308 family)
VEKQFAVRAKVGQDGESTMITYAARNWWVLALRGSAAIIFGIAAWVWPGLTVTVIIILFGAYALVDGIAAIIASATVAGKGTERWLPLLLVGIAGIAFGLVTLVWPGLTALAVLYLIGAWAIVTGVFQIIAAIQLRRQIAGEWLMALGGLGAIVFGILVELFPGHGAIALVWTIGVFAILYGIVLIALGFRLRSWHAGLPA